MNPILEELESLLFDTEAGTIDDAGLERLREILRTSEEARAAFVRRQLLSAAMRLDVDAGLELPGAPIAATGESNSPTPSLRDGRRTFRISYWAVAAAALLIVSLSGRLLHLEFSSQSPARPVADTSIDARDQRDEPTSEGVALVTRLVDVVWGAGQGPLEEGDALAPGRLAIASGLAQVEFFCGATVIVEGPAELELQSPLLARVRSGRLRAQVPPAARGFSLEVEDMKVIDLGTEFGLSVSPDGANLQVFDGAVELKQPESEQRLLGAGRALLRTPQGTYAETNVTPDRFVDIAALDTRASERQDERHERWRQRSEKLRRDERLIAYYAFDQPGDWLRRLGSSLEPADSELDGAIVGAHQVAGRWETKGGLEFKRPGDRVRVQIPGEFSSLTFACWVKIDSLDRWYNSLFLTDHYNQGEPHWQILDTGQLFFSVRHKPDEAAGELAKRRSHQVVLSPPFWKPSLSGRWLHLATTYDADAGRTTHYLNGDVLHTETIDPDLLVRTTRIGAASIGNWSIPTRSDAEFAIRNLNGSIDEFAIFAAALPAHEIREMYEHGKP